MAGGPVATGGGLGGDGTPKNKFAGILMTAFAAFGGILYGYDTGVISGIKEMDDWLRTFGQQNAAGKYHITTGQESLVVSILSAGTFVGALLAAPVGDFLGRKWGVVFSTLIFSVGVALQTGTLSMDVFVVGRVFAGLGVGMMSTLVPMYQSECAPKWIRGAVVSCYQWAITIGLLVAAIANNGTKNRQDHSAWRIPIALQFIWAGILALGMSFLPESPRYLVKRGRDDAARHSLGRLLSVSPDDSAVLQELADIKAAQRAEEEIGSGTYLDCFRQGPNKILTRVMTGVFLQAWQQLTGINFIFYYGTTFFQNSGIRNPFLITIATNVVNVGMTLPGIYLVDKAGRRSLLLIGAAGMLICEFLVAIIGVTISTENQAGQKVLIAFVCIYIAFFASTWGPIAWVVTGEIFPLNIRAKAMSMSTASNWLWNFGIGYATPYLVNSGPGNANLGVKVFFIWGGTCVGCFLFTFFLIPETKGLSLEQIDILYQNTNAIKSVSYRRQLIAEDVHPAAPDAIAPMPKEKVDQVHHKEHV
ncbi:putative glucose transporter rco-3 OS=Neurospora crassa (strain ATCC 24698 / 74-OR23-1A / CBS 708,71 / DSM 1257 / FGSC 987) GN=rco-3 PE=3 SV=2 [Rhizoctonia solani AG-1 IB]|uniref:Putative glucose transporter rco-3 n=1 Tax=Thanatephorus cucumeris (strain AG1-IB / isolate 7/3/14) TaxID=1108050 RepID=A0A0B7FW16_THACB|nr:putative glucose transporter rco-3 OS=Neurospora crassa (strain ATCC 24698 / 74-OR23-1A / CBS 708,71 / DSM 1257 / FGSC 987) GN=rco-3 PE=3 SV=2 [Rhizoctonia solani AG-1 IB]